MSELIIITADDAHKKVQAGKALLVCAYEDDARFARYRLDGAISLRELEARLPALRKDQEIIFYCA
jgi:rhodanese-related sulfurtransferase